MTMVATDRTWKALNWASLVVFALAAGFAAYRFGAWHDEGFTLNTTSGSLARTLKLAIHVERQPPLYFLLLNIWRSASDSVGFARLFSVLAATATGGLVGYAATRLSPENRALGVLSTVIVLTNPFVMLYAAEARGYALQLAIGAGFALVVASTFRRGHASKTDVFALSFLGAAGSHVHYFAGILAVVVVLTLFFRGLLTRRELFAIALAGTVLVLPLLPALPEHFSSHANVESFSLPLLTLVAIVLQTVALLILPQISKDPALSVVAVAAVVAAVAAFAMVKRRRLSPGSKLLLIIAGGSALLYSAVGAASGVEGVQPRYYSPMLPILWLATACSLKDVLGGRGAAVVVLGFASLGALRSGKQIAFDMRPGDWRTAARLVANRSPGPAKVVVFPAPEALAVRSEVRPGDEVIGFPRDYLGDAVFDPENYVFDEAGVRATIGRRVGSATFWVLTAKHPIVSIQHPEAIPKAERFFETQCETLFDTWTRDSRVRQVRLRAVP
jgi:hypothetical protein